MEQLIEIGVFFGKFLVVFFFIAALAILATGLAMKSKMKPDLQVENLNEHLNEIETSIQSVVLSKKELKEQLKANKKKSKTESQNQRRIFLLKFDGDIKASAVKELRDEITAVITVAKPIDEVVLLIESPGGTVHGYGLAAAQILRLKKAGLNVVAAVDKVAASGGYMMACTAHKIIAAPFAIIGSIGVLAQVPNFHKLLKKNNVDYEEISSGEYKRTVSLLGEITEKGRSKFQEQIVETHGLFKSFVERERPQVDISQVATGEYWFGSRAKELRLVDEIMTSDEYLYSQKDSAQIFSIKYVPKKKLSEKLSESLGQVAVKITHHITEKFTDRPLL